MTRAESWRKAAYAAFGLLLIILFSLIILLRRSEPNSLINNASAAPSETANQAQTLSSANPQITVTAQSAAAPINPQVIASASPTETPLPPAEETRIAAENATTFARLQSTLSVTPAVRPCAFMWARQDLPELSAQLQGQIEAAGVAGVTVNAYAFGETCSYHDGRSAFSAMQTDFTLTISGEDFDDAHLGDTAAEIFRILSAYPAGSTPGPNPGRIEFMIGNSPMLLIPYPTAMRWLEEGLSGEALWQAINTSD